MDGLYINVSLLSIRKRLIIIRFGMVCIMLFLWAYFLNIIYKKDISEKVIRKKIVRVVYWNVKRFFEVLIC